MCTEKVIKRVKDRALNRASSLWCGICQVRWVRWRCFSEELPVGLGSVAGWDLEFAGRSRVVGSVTVIRIISLSVMPYTQPRRRSSMCCNASTFDGEEQKRGIVPTVVDVPPNPRWKASQLAGQQLPAELGDLGRSPKDHCCTHLQGMECATHTDTLGK